MATALKRSSVRMKPHHTPVSADLDDPLAIAQGLHRKFQSRARLFGAWMSIGHPEIAAIFARANRDFIGVCMEHTPIDLPAAQQIIRVCHEFRKPCLPRVFGGDLQQIRRLLDAGADGIIVPQVTSRKDIDRVVEVMWYPPAGGRGYGVAAAHGYGRDFDAYVQGANDALSLMVQVESLEGVEHVEEIAAHPAVDAVMVGPYDISGSLGIPGQLCHPRVTAACQRVVAACRRARRSCGTQLVAPTAQQIQEQLAQGLSFLVLGSDVFDLWQRGVEVDHMIAQTVVKRRPATTRRSHASVAA